MQKQKEMGYIFLKYFLKSLCRMLKIKDFKRISVDNGTKIIGLPLQ